MIDADERPSLWEEYGKPTFAVGLNVFGLCVLIGSTPYVAGVLAACLDLADGHEPNELFAHLTAVAGWSAVISLVAIAISLILHKRPKS